MHFKSVMTTALACALVAGGSLAAMAEGPLRPPRPVPGVSQSGPLVLAQSSDAAIRINRLEEHIRSLNGQIEDLNFQMLQLQEEMRRMQEDNELRFQDLESKRGIKRDNSVARRENREPEPSGGSSGETAGSDGIGNLIEQGEADDSGLQPETLGTLTFDEQGNVVGSDVGEPIDLTKRPKIGGILEDARSDHNGDGNFPSSADEIYDLGTSFVQAGDYTQAEQTFGEFLSRYPEHPRAPEARFWLGESLFVQGQFEEAARIFLDTHKQYPQSRMAPQTLLKLGVSLAGMNQRELACATFAEVPKKYPEISNAVRTKLATEQRAASCVVN